MKHILKTVFIVSVILLSAPAMAAEDNLDVAAFIGMDGGAGFLAYNSHVDGDGALGLVFSLGANAGMRFGPKDILYNFGISGYAEIGASPLPDMDDNFAKFWGGAVMFDNYIRMQKSWKRALVLSAGIGSQSFNADGLHNGWVGAIGFTERFDHNLDWTMQIKLFNPSGNIDGFNAGFRMGIRYYL